MLRSENYTLLWPGYSGPLPEGIRGWRNPASAFIQITIGLKSQLSFNPRLPQDARNGGDGLLSDLGN